MERILALQKMSEFSAAGDYLLGSSDSNHCSSDSNKTCSSTSNQCGGGETALTDLQW